MLRTEAASNNVNDYGVNKSIENLPVLRNALAAINDKNYLNVQQDILETFVDRGQLRKSSRNRPSRRRESASPASSSTTRDNSP